MTPNVNLREWQILSRGTCAFKKHWTFCLFVCFYYVFLFFLIFFNFIFLLYNTVLVLPYIDMNPPQVYMSFQPWNPSHHPPHIISLGHPSAPAPSILYPVSNLDWQFISYMIVYMFTLSILFCISLWVHIYIYFLINKI